MAHEVRASFDILAEKTELVEIASIHGATKPAPPHHAGAVSDGRLCTRVRDSEIPGHSDPASLECFEHPGERDVLTLPRGVTYAVMYVQGDGRLVVAIYVDEPFGVDYTTITMERWKELCLTDGARLTDS